MALRNVGGTSANINANWSASCGIFQICKPPPGLPRLPFNDNSFDAITVSFGAVLGVWFLLAKFLKIQLPAGVLAPWLG